MALRLEQIDFGTVSSDEMLVIENGRLKLASQSASTAVQAVASLPPASTATGKLVFDTTAERLAVSDGTVWRHLASLPEKPYLRYAVYKFDEYTGGAREDLPLVPVFEDTTAFEYIGVDTPRAVRVHAPGLISMWYACSLRVTQFVGGIPNSLQLPIGLEFRWWVGTTFALQYQIVHTPEPSQWITVSGVLTSIRPNSSERRMVVGFWDNTYVVTAEIEANSGALVLIAENEE